MISVGNITLGGTNKTPFVEMLCRMLLERVSPWGLSAGGTAERPRTLWSSPRTPLWKRRLLRGRHRRPPGLVGDEPLLLASGCGAFPWLFPRTAPGHRSPLGQECEVIAPMTPSSTGGWPGMWISPWWTPAAPSGTGGGPRAYSGTSRRAVPGLPGGDHQVGPGSGGKLRTLAMNPAVRAEERDLLQAIGSHLAAGRERMLGCGTMRRSPHRPRLFRHRKSRELRRSLEQQGIAILREHRFKDHHRYGGRTWRCWRRPSPGAGGSHDLHREGYLQSSTDWRPSGTSSSPSSPRSSTTSALRKASPKPSGRIVVASTATVKTPWEPSWREAQGAVPRCGGSSFPSWARGSITSKKAFRGLRARDSPSGGVIKYRCPTSGDLRRASPLHGPADGGGEAAPGAIRTPSAWGTSTSCSTPCGARDSSPPLGTARRSTSAPLAARGLYQAQEPNRLDPRYGHLRKSFSVRPAAGSTQSYYGPDL